MPATIPAIIELQTESAKEIVDITARVEALLVTTPAMAYGMTRPRTWRHMS